MKLVAALALAAVLVGCGSDTLFIISFTSGTIDDDPTCSGSGGQFNLREQEGLTVLVVINSSTLIFVGSNRGRCRDLSRNDAVGVRGPRQGNQITAQSIEVQ